MTSSNSARKRCYICLEVVKDPICPSGCNHEFCKEHFKNIIKPECGECRRPFKKQFLPQDPSLIGILLKIQQSPYENIHINNSSLNTINASNNFNINFNILNNNINNSRLNENRDVILNRLNMTNQVNNIDQNFSDGNKDIININNEISNDSTNNLPTNKKKSIFNWNPSKPISILILILNIIPGGVGTIILGFVKKKNKNFWFLYIGICQIISIYLFLYLILKLRILLAHIYFFILFLFSECFSIYFGIFENIYEFRNKKKVKAFLLIIENIVFAGVGTIQASCFSKKICLFLFIGFAQFIGFLLLLAVILTEYYKILPLKIYLPIIIYGGVSYISGIIITLRFYCIVRNRTKF